MIQSNSSFSIPMKRNGRYDTEEAKNPKKFLLNQQSSKIFKEEPDLQFITRNVINKRPQPRIIYKDTVSSDSDAKEEFTASPADDIPRNRLVEKLVRGMQAYLERMQRREDYRMDCKKV